MIKQKQLYRHKPAEGVIGDCHRTAIACMLDLDVTAVPHFGKEHYEDPVAFHAAFKGWLEKEHGVTTVTIGYADVSLAEMLQSQAYHAKGVYYLLGGFSRTLVNHTVVGCGGEIAWDPSLDDAGITGPCDDGVFWITYLVPLRFTDREPSLADLAPPAQMSEYDLMIAEGLQRDCDGLTK
jgi:hypothetical protein